MIDLTHWKEWAAFLLQIIAISAAAIGILKWIGKRASGMVRNEFMPAVTELSGQVKSLASSTEDLSARTSETTEMLRAFITVQHDTNQQVAVELGRLHERTIGGRRHTDPHSPDARG